MTSHAYTTIFVDKSPFEISFSRPAPPGARPPGVAVSIARKSVQTYELASTKNRYEQQNDFPVPFPRSMVTEGFCTSSVRG